MVSPPSEVMKIMFDRGECSDVDQLEASQKTLLPPDRVLI